MKFYNFVKKNYMNDQPHYISDPDKSHIHVLSYVEYKAMSANAVQLLLRDYHIATTGFPTEQVIETDQVDFNKAGLQLLKNLKAPIKFQGKSSQSSFDHCKTIFSLLQINQSQLVKTTQFRSAQEH